MKSFTRFLHARGLIFGAATLLVMTLSFGGTYALLAARDEKPNEFVVGQDEIGITEVFEPPTKLVPGVSFRKEPTILNTGNVPNFVRVRVEFSNGQALDILEPLVYDDINWEKHGAYYYYKHALQPGESTTALFSQVKVSETRVSNGDPLEDADMLDFDILIYAESKMQPDPKEPKGYLPEDEYKHIWGGW